MTYEIQILAIPATKDSNITVTIHNKSSQGQSATPVQLLGILSKQLETGIGVFMYRKKDGGIRKAIGTTSTAIIPISKLTGKSAQQFDTKLNYFDLEAQEFRSFDKESLLAVLCL